MLPILEGRQTSIHQLLKFAPKSIKEKAIHAILTMKRYNVVKNVRDMILKFAFSPSNEDIKKAINVVLHTNGYLNRSNIMLSATFQPVVVSISNHRSIELPTFLWGDELIEMVTELNDEVKEEPMEKKRKIVE